jgi:DNA-binding SARP family transcriptional activator
VFLYLARGVRAATRSRRGLPVFQVQHLGSLRAFARRFFEALFAALPARAVLVLDNCHAVAGDRAFTDILDEAVAAVPAARGLVLVSRAEPPAALARQIVSQRLASVTGEELRFSDREAGALARARVPARARRDRRTLAALCALANGWAAGLVLALDHAARGELPADLARREGPLFDYLSAEILAELPPEAQRVLLATALLPCVTAKMAAAVAESDGAGALLADLHRRGLLVERLRTAEATYRYHPLLRAFLLARAEPSAATLARAAAACAEGGFLDEAVDLHARAGAEGEVAALVLGHAPRLVAEGRFQTLSAWVGRLGEATLASQPWLRFWQATANLPQDQAASRAQFEQAFAGFEARGDAAGMYLCIGGAIQLVIVESEDFRRLDPWLERFTRISAAGPAAPSDDVEAAALTGAMMVAAFSRPGVADAETWARRALALAPTDVGTRVRLWASVLGWQSNAGRLDLDPDLAARLRPEVNPTLDPVTRLMMNEAVIFHGLRKSWRHVLPLFERGLGIARAAGLQIFEATNLAGAALCHAIGGESERAAECLRQAEAAEAAVPGSHLVRAGLLDLTRGTLAFAAGDFERAAAHLGRSVEQAAAIGGGRTGWGEMTGRMLRRLALDAAGRHEEARREAALLTGEGAPLGVTRVGAELADAEVALRAGDPVEGRRRLALALADLRDFDSFAFFYLGALPNALEKGLRDPVHGPWLAERIADHRMRPAAQHLDLAVWPWPLRVRTLGGFALSGHPGAERSRKTQKAPLRLLKCLVATGGEPLPVSAACEALWPDEAPAAARRTLDITLHRLRKLVGEDVVRLSDGALTIDRERCFVDAWAFASLAARAERRLRQANGEAAAGEARALFDQARKLYRGRLLPADDDVAPVVAHRELLHRRFVHLVLAFGAALEPRAWTEAVVIYEQAVDVDELAEPLSQGLMRAYLAVGRAADAAKEYHRCQLALHAALGTPPSEETRALYRQARMTTQHDGG